MIRKLQQKFVFVSSFAVFLILVAVLGLSNYVNFKEARTDICEILDYLCENNGSVPAELSQSEMEGFSGSVTRDTLLKLRYFYVRLDTERHITYVNLDNISEIDKNEAKEAASDVSGVTKARGVWNNNGIEYIYQKNNTADGGSIYVFLDISNELYFAKHFLIYSSGFGLLCLVLFIILVSVFSKRALSTVITAIENQKQFITNAGHELKTPVAIISANAELMEITGTKNESLDNIRQQASRLSELIDDLISLARLGENRKQAFTMLDASSMAGEVFASFEPLAKKEGKGFEYSVDPGIHIMADDKDIRELMNILTDNAVKYCDKDGRIIIKCKRRTKTKGIKLSVANSYADAESVDCDSFFKRFYRGDSSHNSTLSGYGIGLSMAQKIAESYKGSIRICAKKGMIKFTFTM